VQTTNLKTSLLKPEAALHSFVVEAGDPFVVEITQGQYVRIVDLEGNQAVDTIFYNAHDYADRYSAQDTIREQGNVYLTTGTSLVSTSGNVLLTITADMHACRNSFLKGIQQWNRGMDKRDITSNINFFMNVPVTPDGNLTFEDGVSDAGKYVELRAEMDVLMVISNCPQLNNPCNGYNPTPVQILIWDKNVQ